jgi:adenylate cyclase
VPIEGAEAGRLLVVDDNRVNRLLLGRTLEQQGHTVAFAADGRRALEMLATERFDLVLLDVEMPELDGVAMLKQLAADGRLLEMPVIMTSALDEVERIAECIGLGADDFLSKPVNPVLLKARVSSSLAKKRWHDEQRLLMRRFATEEVVDDLARSGFAIGGSSVEASILFCDIRGFTTLCESQSANDTIELLNTFYTLMFDAVEEHDGLVTMMAGDGFMAVFGAPTPRPDHAPRAVRAGLEMLDLIGLFGAEQQAQGKPRIRIGVGVASGSVIAGYAGTQHRATFTCVGDVVNLAARLEAHTKEVGEPLIVDGDTLSRLDDRFDVRSHGEARLKGKARPVMVFSISGERDASIVRKGSGRAAR